MSPTTSSKTFRIQGLNLDTTTSRLEDTLNAAQKSKERSKLKLFSSPGASQAACFLARQNDFISATVSFPSAGEKSQAMKALVERCGEWKIDDCFDGVTVLHAANEIELE